jgi:cytochrome c-type biogenesis protein CcmH/NrfG
LLSGRFQQFLISALLAATVLVVYAPVTGYDFIRLDDAGYVRANEHINGGFSLAGLQWILKNPVGGNWHPVTMLSHMADCQLYGLYAGGHHLTNVLLHVANTVLLFLVLLEVAGERKPSNLPLQGSGKLSKPNSRHQSGNALPHPLSTINCFWQCAFAAALFGLHPLRVESVAWISERKDVLSGFFFMLTIWTYARFARESKAQSASSQEPGRPGSRKAKFFYSSAHLLFALGLMSKPMLVTVPFVLLLLDFWPLDRISFGRPQTSPGSSSGQKPSRRTFIMLLCEKIPFFALAAVFSVVTFFVQKSYGAVVALEYLPLAARLASVMVSYANYLGKILWPHPLAMLYPYHDCTSLQIAASVLLFGGISLAAFYLRKRKPWLFVGWFWFAGVLVPVVGFVQVGIQVTADRYTYLPSIGVFIALAWGLADWLARASVSRDSVFRQKAGTPSLRPLAVCGAILSVALLVVTTATQTRYWKNTQTLFEHSVRVTGDNTDAHYMLGALFVEQGKTNEAFLQFTESVRDNPTNVKARCGLGYILFIRGQFGEAADQYRAALGIESDSAKAHFGLAEVLRKQHQDADAEEEYLLALKFDPTHAQAHYQLAALYSARHDAASAILHLREAVRLSPNWFLGLNNLAWMLATEPDPQLRNGPEARELAIRAAAAAGGNNPNALDTLAAAYAEMGRFTEAVQTAQIAIRSANAKGESDLVAEINSRLKLYQSQKVFRE